MKTQTQRWVILLALFAEIIFLAPSLIALQEVDNGIKDEPRKIIDNLDNIAGYLFRLVERPCGRVSWEPVRNRRNLEIADNDKFFVSISGDGFFDSDEFLAEYISSVSNSFLLNNIIKIHIGFMSIGSKSISELLSFKHLSELEFSDCQFVDQDSVISGILLRQIIVLEELSLRGSSFSEKLIENLSGSNVSTIDLSHSNVSNSGANHLASLRHLESINLSLTCISDEALINFNELQSLKKLNLAGTNVSDIGLKALSRNFNIMELDLSSTDLTDIGVEVLSSMNSLKLLSMPNTGITDKAIDFILNADRLVYVNLAGTKVTEEGVNRLKEREGLRVYFTELQQSE